MKTLFLVNESVSFHFIAFKPSVVTRYCYVRFCCWLLFYSVYIIYIVTCVQNNIHLHIHIIQFKSKGGNKFIFMPISCRRNNMTKKRRGGGGRGRETKNTFAYVRARARTHTHTMERKGLWGYKNVIKRIHSAFPQGR